MGQLAEELCPRQQARTKDGEKNREQPGTQAGPGEKCAVHSESSVGQFSTMRREEVRAPGISRIRSRRLADMGQFCSRRDTGDGVGYYLHSWPRGEGNRAM